MLGWDYVSGGQLASLPEFRKQFGIRQADGSYLIPSYVLSAWQAIGPACDVVAAVLSAPLLEKWGRKPQVIVAVVLSTVGVLLQQIATEWKTHLAGRAVNGAAVGIMFTISPLWIGESCRPELRGFFLCFFNTSIVLGQFLIVLISYGASFIEGKWQWWTVVVSMYFFPATLLLLYPWFPESPHWLIRENKKEKARQSLERMYGKTKQQLIDHELNRLEEDVRMNTEVQANLEGPRYTIFGIEVGQELECFRGTNLKRSITAMFASSGQQLIGATFAIGYTTYFFELIGIKQYFLASCMMYVVMLISTGAAFHMIEVVGRRTLIVPALFILSAILLAMGIAGCFESTAALWSIVVLMYLWALVYQISLGACGFVLASEVATLRLRATTQALVTMMNGVWGLIMQFTIPYMINPDSGNLGGKAGSIFFGTGLLTAMGGYFLFPETKGISFAKMDELYQSGIKPRHFKKVAEAGTEDQAVEKL
ncbi:Hexose transporter [Fusarium albosuccineum]|uniref:Hexose transporter n=1 Tax=Fusarium albosuccineum TaxID=1237068 RepID=A0A8H4PH15_9HYPO|nr:Hexose transporter [Fusarium albosuccineum]